jgi:hypothetical protein
MSHVSVTVCVASDCKQKQAHRVSSVQGMQVSKAWHVARMNERDW